LLSRLSFHINIYKATDLIHILNVN